MADRTTVPIAALTLVASLRAALTAARYVSDRRAGRIAANDDAPAAEDALAVVGLRMESELSLLRVRLALGAPDDDTGAFIQEFHDRLLVAELAADLAEAHRHLLTLFPAVDADLVETTRRTAVEANSLADMVDFEAAAPALAGRVEAVLYGLHDSR